MTAFIPGLRLSELFYREAVRPILDRAFPGLTHSAGLLGYGSEVLGFDTERSTDHEWGPRVLLFLTEGDRAARAPAVDETLRRELPREFRGYPTGFGPPDAEGVRLPVRGGDGPVDHKVEVTTLPRFLNDRLGVDSVLGLDAVDWLLWPEQRLLEVTGGAVFHDGLGELGRVRAALAYYPRDVWLYLLAAQWKRIAQQEAFVGRCGETGDDLGSALVAGALVRDLMRLCVLMGRRYAPYSKWFGLAFARLACAPRLMPHLTGAVAARTWPERERHLSTAYSAVAALHNGLGISAPLPTEVVPFHSRPFLVIDAGRFVEAIRSHIGDERVRRLPADIGGVDQWVDSTDVLTRGELRARLRAIYDADA